MEKEKSTFPECECGEILDPLDHIYIDLIGVPQKWHCPKCGAEYTTTMLN